VKVVTQPAIAAIAEFMRFALVGGTGFIVDIAVLQLYLTLFGDRPFSAQALAWCVAVTTNWWMNRSFTFATRHKAPLLQQWAQYVAVNSGGALVNYAVYAALVALIPLCRTQPWLAVAAGTIAALGLNFIGAKRFVFRSTLGQ
jgi:putative flippase GtrA